MLKHNRCRRLLDFACYWVLLADFATSLAKAIAISALDGLAGAVYPPPAQAKPVWRQESILWRDDFVW